MKSRLNWIGGVTGATLLLALGSPAGADSVAVFYSGGVGYNAANPFSGGGTVYAATNGASIATCTTSGGGTCGALINGDLLQTSINFATTVDNPVLITASTGSPAVWWDKNPAFGGLGLQTASGPAGTGDDQIEASGILRLHFASAVTLTGVATLFDNPHEDFGIGNKLTGSFLFCAGNLACNPTTQVSFSEANSANGTLGTLSTGTDFAFAELNGTGGNVEFYVSAITYNPVPGPIVGAGLPGLIAACGGLLALARRRRKLVV